MTQLNANVENSDSSQTLCELELWSPPQGTIPEAIPLSIDLDFDAETVQFPTSSFTVRARRASIHLRSTDADLVRGSRLGEHVPDPQMIAEVTQSVRDAIEVDTGTQGRIEVEVKPNVLGRLTAAVFWKKRRSKKSEHDHIVKSSMRVSRVVPRTNGKWSIVEPVAPHILNGRYIGSAGEIEIGPLCLLTMRRNMCLVQIVITVNRNDLEITSNNSGVQHSRNKVAVIEAMTRRAIATNQVTDFALPPNISHEDIVLARSVMEISVADD